jgi:hypothetical protein
MVQTATENRGWQIQHRDLAGRFHRRAFSFFVNEVAVDFLPSSRLPASPAAPGDAQ